MLIRLAKESDAQQICEVLKIAIRQICGPDYANDETVLQEWLSNKTVDNVTNWINANRCSFVACADEKIIGFILMDDQGDLLLNYLLPDYLHQGIGKALLKHIERYAQDNHIEAITVKSTISACNFYRRNGFIANGDPIRVGSLAGEFPLIKYLVATERN